MRDASAAARALAEATGTPLHDVAIVLGSGWIEAVSTIPSVAEAPLSSLPGFEATAVAGHGSSARSLRAGDVRVLAFTGRHHYYESRDVDLVAHSVRTAAAAGCRAVVLTSASGGIRDDLTPGSLMPIRAHLEWTRAFPSLESASPYSPRLLDLVVRAGEEMELPLYPGVYAQLTGPCYETPAEIREGWSIGGHMDPQSTALRRPWPGPCLPRSPTVG